MKAEILQVRINQHDKLMLEAFCRATNQSMSDVARYAIKEYVRTQIDLPFKVKI